MNWNELEFKVNVKDNENCCVLQGKRDECYETRLRIQRVELNDGRHYYLTVENEKGTDSFYVTLNVKGNHQKLPITTNSAVLINNKYNNTK